jgi:hypothetical protein
MPILPDARTGEEEPYSQRDLAAFVVSSSPALSRTSFSKEKQTVPWIFSTGS